MSNEELTDYDFFSLRKPERTYISKRLKRDSIIDGIAPTPPHRLVHRVIETQEQLEFVNLKGEVVLRVSPSEKVQLKVVVYEYPRKIYGLQFQRYERKTGTPHKAPEVLSLRIEELNEIMKLLEELQLVSLDDPDGKRYENVELEKLLIDENERREYLATNPELVRKVVESDITEFDIVGLAYRKGQLDVFEQLLVDADYFEKKKIQWEKRRPEDVWQHFFEKNTWIFGYGLGYLFNQPFDENKLERVVVGADNLGGVGKRIDALMETSGAIKSVCFVEIKRHDTQLISSQSYRSGSWGVSKDVVGGIAQIQSTVQLSIERFQDFINKKKSGFFTNDGAFLYKPRSYLVIGQLAEFLDDDANPHSEKFRSFELFRREMNNPEIITFDELFARAKFIVRHSSQNFDTQSSEDFESDDFDTFSATPQELDDIPF